MASDLQEQEGRAVAGGRPNSAGFTAVGASEMSDSLGAKTVTAFVFTGHQRGGGH